MHRTPPGWMHGWIDAAILYGQLVDRVPDILTDKQTLLLHHAGQWHRWVCVCHWEQGKAEDPREMAHSLGFSPQKNGIPIV